MCKHNQCLKYLCSQCLKVKIPSIFVGRKLSAADCCVYMNPHKQWKETGVGMGVLLFHYLLTQTQQARTSKLHTSIRVGRDAGGRTQTNKKHFRSASAMLNGKGINRGTHVHTWDRYMAQVQPPFKSGWADFLFQLLKTPLTNTNEQLMRIPSSSP